LCVCVFSLAGITVAEGEENEKTKVESSTSQGILVNLEKDISKSKRHANKESLGGWWFSHYQYNRSRYHS
jgi:hypothetical protein